MYARQPRVSISGRSGGSLQLGFGQFFGLAAPLHFDFHAVVGGKPGPGRNEPAHNDVFLEPDEPVDLAVDRRLGEHSGGLLERRGRDEAFGRQRGLGDPEQQRLRDCGLAAFLEHPGVFFVETPLLDLVANQKIGVLDLLDSDPPQHLANDRLDVLVVDAHALQPVDLLDFVHQVLGQRLLAENRQNVVRVRRAFHQRLARLDHVALVHADVLALRDQVLARLAHFRGDDQLALALGILAERHLPVDFRNDRELLGLACLKQLGDPRETAGDVLGLGGFTRNLGDHVACLDLDAFGHIDVSADRQEVARIQVAVGNLDGLAAAVLDRYARAYVEILELDDNIGARAGSLVDPLLHGLALEDVAELHGAIDFGDDRRGIRIPLCDELRGLDVVAFALAQLGAVHQRITFAFALANVTIFALDLRGDDHFAVAGHHDQRAIAARNRVHVVQADHAFVARLQGSLLGAPARGATDVEGAHGELSARLPDRLGGDDSYRLAEIDQVPAPQVAAIAAHAHAAARLAGQHRANLDSLDTRILDLLDAVLIDHLVGPDQHLASEGVVDILQRDASQHPVTERLDDFTAFHQGRHLDAIERATVFLGDDRVLRHVDQPPGEIAGVGRLERGVRQALARAVGRGEVLADGQTFAKVGGNRGLDYFTRGLGHQSAQTGQLANLLLRAARPRIGHDEDRVEGRPGDLLAVLVLAVDFGGQALDDGTADFILDLGPDVDDLVVALAVGDDPVVVLLLDIVDLPLRVLEQLCLLGRDDHVLDRDGNSRAGCELEAHILELVSEDDGCLVAGATIDHVDQVAEFLFLESLVDLCKRNLGRDDLIKKDAADRGLDPLGNRPLRRRGRFLAFGRAAVGLRRRIRANHLHPHRDAGMQVDFAVVIRDANFFRAREELAFDLCEQALAGHVVEPQHHVLGRHDDRTAGGRRQDVVGRHHERARLHLRLD